MACVTCDHKMISIGEGNFWCSRCGTIKCRKRKKNGKLEEYFDSPVLADRVRDFLRDFAGNEEVQEACNSRGITESVFDDGAHIELVEGAF